MRHKGIIGQIKKKMCAFWNDDSGVYLQRL